ncbi:FtsQ Cell division septal protein [Candidatus Nanopelagicaceae bacterium]
MRNSQRLVRTSISIGIIFAALIYLLAWSSVFTVKEISVSGAPTKVSKELVLSSSEISVGQKLARIEPRSAEHRIQSLPWIKEIAITRNWISGQVEIAVTPRTPKAYYNGKTLDASGKIFELPGFDGRELPKVSASTPALGVKAVALFRALPVEFRDQVTSLTAINEANFQLSISYKGRNLSVKWGANEENPLKVEVFNALLEQAENKRIKRVDLSAPHAPIVK